MTGVGDCFPWLSSCELPSVSVTAVEEKYRVSCRSKKVGNRDSPNASVLHGKKRKFDYQRQKKQSLLAAAH